MEAKFIYNNVTVSNLVLGPLIIFKSFKPSDWLRKLKNKDCAINYYYTSILKARQCGFFKLLNISLKYFIDAE